jgi:aminopeptidase N
MKIKVFQKGIFGDDGDWAWDIELYTAPISDGPFRTPVDKVFRPRPLSVCHVLYDGPEAKFSFPNYQDYGYGIFLLDAKSHDYVLKNIQNEKDAFLRSMMYGALWDSVREGELDPKTYVELAIKNLPTESDETIASSILGRTATALNYYIGGEGGNPSGSEGAQRGTSSNSRTLPTGRVSASIPDMRTRFEAVLLDRLQHAATAGQRITFYRAFVTNASTERSRTVLKQMLAQAGKLAAQPMRAGSPRSDVAFTLRTKDKFDIVTRLAILGDPDAPKLLAEVEKTETSDDARRYAYAARAGFATPENKAKYWNDFTANKDISESWIEAAIAPFNSIRHSDLTLPYLERSLAELPNLKRTRKIFFVNNWLAAFIGGQRSDAALNIVNKFLADNPKLDNDLRLKILENVDLIERAVKIRARFSK